MDTENLPAETGQAGTVEDQTNGVLVPVTLVPVEVFGGPCDCHEEAGEPDDCSGWGYGLMDAVPAWSDCNRAIGRIYRVQEPGFQRCGDPDNTITVYVPADQVSWFDRKWGDGYSD